MGIIIIVIILFAIIKLLSQANKPTDKSKERDTRSRSTSTTIACPHCGSPAKDYGSYWECGYCGDCGYFR